MPERAEKEKRNERRQPVGIWSGTVSFGLVSIPVALMPANRAGGPRFRTLAPDGTPVSRRWVCSKEEVPLDDDDIVRGWEVRPAKWVTVTDDELAKLEPEKSREIKLDRLVPCDEIDPLYFDRAYYLVPTGGSSKAYALLAKVMEDTQHAGIATFVMHDREYLVALLASNGILRVETFRFADEVRHPDDVGLPKPEKADPKRVAAFARALGKLEARRLDEKLLADDYAERVEALVREKREQGRDVVENPAAAAAEEGETVDLMSALRRALGGSRAASRRTSAARREGGRRRRAGGRRRRKGKRGAA